MYIVLFTLQFHAILQGEIKLVSDLKKTKTKTSKPKAADGGTGGGY